MQELIKKYTERGVLQNKIIVTKQPSVVIWSTSRKCIVGGTEIIIDKKKNRFFNLGMYLEGKSWVKEVKVIS